MLRVTARWYISSGIEARVTLLSRRLPDEPRGGLVHVLGRWSGPVRLADVLYKRLISGGLASGGNGILQMEQRCAPW